MLWATSGACSTLSSDEEQDEGESKDETDDEDEDDKDNGDLDEEDRDGDEADEHHDQHDHDDFRRIQIRPNEQPLVKCDNPAYESAPLTAAGLGRMQVKGRVVMVVKVA